MQSKKQQQSLSARAPTITQNVNDRKNYCGVCEVLYDDNEEYWIGYKECDTWFHGDCVGVVPNNGSYSKLQKPHKCHIHPFYEHYTPLHFPLTSVIFNRGYSLYRRMGSSEHSGFIKHKYVFFCLKCIALRWQHPLMMLQS